MKHLSTISYAIAISGLLVIAAAAAAGLSPLFTLAGWLLLLAGIVKIVVVQIWRRLAGL
jgi:hypothetical protein